MPVSIIGLDIAKSVFQVHGADHAGNPVLRRQLRRHDVADSIKFGLRVHDPATKNR